MREDIVPNPSRNSSATKLDQSILTSEDLHLFNEGRHTHAYLRMGAHLEKQGTKSGAWFSVWAPGARRVSVIGEFNQWKKDHSLLLPMGVSGVWSAFVPGVQSGDAYKFHIIGDEGFVADKADPFAFYSESAPQTASLAWSLDYPWGDEGWLESRARRQAHDQPMSIYEIHLGSWRRKENGHFLTYRELARELPQYVKSMGFTHVEFMPVMEHPFYGSWGYQTTGYFAPTARHGTPQDLMYLIDQLHQQGIGVILDWVPSHFPSDDFSLGFFQGTHLYEHEDTRKGFHPDWNSLIFNYDRHEVRSFLISSAMFWLDRYHVDGLRVDAVASMLYLDYSRKEGEWIPNQHGGRENLGAIEFLKSLNEAVYREFPDVHMIAEESTAWPRVSAPTYLGGLGFGMKWDMGWMHDSLAYFTRDPIHRKYHQSQLTFRMIYAFHENFVLPLSHDEVVHGKGSLIGKMPGDEWQRFANLRALYCYMYAQPGKKLLFMGGEFAQDSEWNHESALDWHLLNHPLHLGTSLLIRDLNQLYQKERALHAFDFSEKGHEWCDANDSLNSVISFFRKGEATEDQILVVLNLTPIPRLNYRLGVPEAGYWMEILNSDASIYGGSGYGNLGGVESKPLPAHGRYHSLNLTLPPLSAVFLKKKPETKAVAEGDLNG